MTVEELELAITESTGMQVVTPENVAEYLCGQQAHLADNPFSVAFIQNVAYNSLKSFYCVLYLQLRYAIEHSNSY